MFHNFFLGGKSLCKEMGQRSTLNRDQDSTGEIRLSNLFWKVRAPLYLDGSGFCFIWRGSGLRCIWRGQGSTYLERSWFCFILRGRDSTLFGGIRIQLFLEKSGLCFIWRGLGSTLFRGQGSTLFGGVRVPLYLERSGFALFGGDSTLVGEVMVPLYLEGSGGEILLIFLEERGGFILKMRFFGGVVDKVRIELSSAIQLCFACQPFFLWKTLN